MDFEDDAIRQLNLIAVLELAAIKDRKAVQESLVRAAAVDEFEAATRDFDVRVQA